MVDIVLPSHLHFEAAKAALEAGCHVLLEKPIAGDPAPLKEKSSHQGLPLAGPGRPGCLDLTREASLVDLAAGLAAGVVGVWAATGGRARAGRGADEEPPSKASDTSIASFTSPRGPALPPLAAGAAWVGLESALPWILLSNDGT